MKIRNGFVSNSSSSSFVIVGLKTDEMNYTEMRNLGLSCRYMDNGEYVTGIVITDDEYLDESFTSITVLQEMAQKVADALKVDINEIGLMTGTRAS